jgi:phosphate-selective porin OprO/OprP
MLRTFWRTLGRGALCGAALLAGASLVQAQGNNTPQTMPIVPSVVLETPKTPGLALPTTTPAPANETAELKARLERLERQNQELMDALKGIKKAQLSAPTSTAVDANSAGLTANDVRSIINNYFSEKEAQERIGEGKKVDAGPPTYTVGKNLGLTGVWTNHQPWFETQDKAFRIHVGGRFQPEWVFGAGADTAVISGKGGTGAFQEGFNWRRARLEVDGWMYEVIDFMVEYDFANQFSSGQPFTTDLKTGAVRASPNNDANTFGVPAPTDVWAGINYMPVIGGLRIGNLKPAIGLDHLTSSRYLDFLERSIGFDTYYNRNNGFEPGFMIFNYTADQRLAWQLSATKPTNTLFGWTTGGGEWKYAGRLTGLPWYEDNGRRMVHLGMGAAYIDHLDLGRANLNDRWLLRNGGPNLQNVVSQVNAFGISQSIVNPEFFMNLGPLSIQAEYIGSWVNGVTSYITQLTGGTAVPVTSRTFFSQTAYVQAMYFLTGEHRPYGKTALHGSGAAPTRVVPYRNYFWVPGHGGNCNPFSAGAWQVGARYCWSDLNDNGINGGTVNEVTIGLNWFLNPNMKIQWNYDIGHRSLTGGTSDGYYYGFGMRMAVDF